MQFDSRPTVLYVDDEAMARKYFEHAAGARYRVLTADGVTAALAVLAASGSQVDVLVTDYRMPDRLGSELLQEAARHYPHIVCLLVTAYADKDVLLELINGGTPFRLLEKPLDAAAMLDALQLAVQAGRQRAARRQGLMAIDESLAFLAHELNAPLAAMANFARGIERRADGSSAAGGISTREAEIAEAAALMHGHARYCLSVLARFVDTVRLACRGPGMQDAAGAEAHSAAQLLALLLDSYPLSAAQRAAITVRIDNDFEIAESPNCVSLILASVLGNALQALQQQAAPRLLFVVDASRITLRDNGGGIDPAIVARLLHDPHSSGEAQGGLMFCQRMMQSFGGALEIASEPGHSTSVSLNFPVRHIAVPYPLAQPRSEHD